MTHCATVHRGSTAQQAGGTWGNTVYTMATFYTFFTLLQPFCSVSNKSGHSMATANLKKS